MPTERARGPMRLDDPDFPCALLTPAQMAAADRAAIADGTPGIELMEHAGDAVAREAAAMLPDAGRVTILCGSGNNGGDGFVAARLLAQSGYAVTLGVLSRPRPSKDAATNKGDAAKGDANTAAARWAGDVLPWREAIAHPADLIVDALFGTGLNRALRDDAAAVVREINASGVPVLAVDVPSGLDAETGLPVSPTAPPNTGGASLPVVRAMRTITFFRLKSGHLLNEGAKFCGELVLARIGIAESALDRVAPPAARMEITRPAVWINHLPRLADDTHKYARGHAVVLSGPAHATGAARLAAHAALRSGAGVVSVAARPSAVLVNASHLTEIMVKRIASSDEIQAVFAEPRVRALVLGPGAGVTPETRDAIDRALATQGSVILDADALTCLANDPDLRARMRRRRAPGATVLTPHAGEFRRLYPDGDPGSLDTLRRCAADDNAVLVAKGPRTLIVAPDGRVAVSIDAPPTLATAGSGDVLAGIIAGLTAQGMPGFEASMAAVWLHARAAHHVGLGLIASDLPHALPAVFQELAIVAGRAVEAGASATQSS